MPDRLKGINSLRLQLDAVVGKQIVSTTPEILDDLQQQIERRKEHLSQLESVTQAGSARDFCTDLHSIIDNALFGRYDHTFFFCDDAQSTKQRKLHSCIQDILTDFKSTIRSSGHAYDSDEATILPFSTVQRAEAHPELTSRSAAMKYLNSQLKAWGNSGDFPHKLASVLFYKKATKWPALVRRLSLDIQKMVEGFLQQHLLPTLCPSIEIQPAIADLVVNPTLAVFRTALEVQVNSAVAPWDEQERIMFDDSITQCRHGEFTKELRRAIEEMVPRRANGVSHHGRSPYTTTIAGESIDISSLYTALDQVNLTQITAAGVVKSVKLYYKVCVTLQIPQMDMLTCVKGAFGGAGSHIQPKTLDESRSAATY